MNAEDRTLTTLLVSYNTRQLLDPCLAALRLAEERAGLAGSPVIVVDNASVDGSAEHLAEKHSDVMLMRSPQNVGFGRANNMALPGFDSRYLLLLNTDAFVPEDSLKETIAYMDAHADVGILGVRLVGRDGEPQPSSRHFPTPASTFVARMGWQKWFPKVRLVDDPNENSLETRECDWVPGCFYLIRREVIAQVGLFDPRYFLYFEEVDHCLAAKRAGWKVVCFPHVQVVHIGGESARAIGELGNASRQVETLQIESALLYYRKNFGLATMLRQVALELVGDLILLVKGEVRRRGRANRRYHLRRFASALALARRTSWGTRPTR